MRAHALQRYFRQQTTRPRPVYFSVVTKQISLRANVAAKTRDVLFTSTKKQRLKNVGRCQWAGKTKLSVADQRFIHPWVSKIQVLWGEKIGCVESYVGHNLIFINPYKFHVTKTQSCIFHCCSYEHFKYLFYVQLDNY